MASINCYGNLADIMSVAPVTMIDSGTPRPSTSRWRLLPFFPPIRRIWPHGFLCQRRLHHRSVDTLPSPRNAFQVIVLRQPGLPQGFKHASLLPLQKALVNGTLAPSVGKPSTDSPCATRTQSPRTPRADPSAYARRQVCAQTSASAAAPLVAGSAVRRAPRMHRKLPMTRVLPWPLRSPSVAHTGGYGRKVYSFIYG